MRFATPGRCATLLVIAALAAASSACGDDAPMTEILVVADSNLSVPSELDTIRFEVSGVVGGPRSASVLLGGASPVALPATLGLVHRTGPLGPVTVAAIGSLAGRDVVTRRATVTFLPERVVVLRMDLFASCRSVMCPSDETCAELGCRPVAVSPSELVDWTGRAPRLDASVPADGGGVPRDAGMRDAGRSLDAGRDAGTRDAGRDAGGDAGADADGDGVPNVADNCVNDANPDQANEDGDLRGDVCDLCPPFSDAGEDGDTDGVGDLCDPHPATRGDRIVHFEGFFSGLPSGWSVEGMFEATVEGDALGTAPSGAGAVLSIASPPGTTHDHIWASASLDSFVGPALAGMGVTVRRQAGFGDFGVACQLIGMAGMSASDRLRLFDSTGLGTLADGVHELSPGTDYVLKMSRDGTDYTCGSSSPDVGVTGSTPFMPTSPEVGLRVRSATARYHWVMVLSSP